MSLRTTVNSTADNRLGDRALKNEVYATIVSMIHRRELRPGARVSEADIARRLGISRGPVREAFAQLVHEGLLIHKPRSGNFVTQLNAEALEDIRDARRLLEGHVAARACLRMTPQDVAVLRELVVSMAAAARNQQWIEATRFNATFHQTVVRIAGGEIFTRLWRTVDPLAWLLAPAATAPAAQDPEDLVARHEALINALLSGDPERASRAFRDHVDVAAQMTVGTAGESGLVEREAGE